MRVITSFLLIIGVFISTFTVNAKQCEANCMIAQINGYFAALDKVAKHGSTAQDIESLLEQMHPSIKYEHFEYQANFDLVKWRKAFNRQLKLGSYNNAPEDEIRVVNTIIGKSHVAVEYLHGLVDEKGDWKPNDDMKKFALFGFTEGKISLIREYW